MGWCRSAESLYSTPRYESRGFTCNCPAASNVLHGAWGTIALDTISAYYLSSTEEEKLEIKDEPESFRDATAQKKRFTVAALNPCIPYTEPSESEDEQSDLDDEDTDSMEGQTQGVQPLGYVQGSLAPAQVAIQSMIQGHQSLQDFPNLIFNMIAPGRTQPSHDTALKPYCAIDYAGTDICPTEGGDFDIPFLILTKEEVFLVQHAFAKNMTSIIPELGVFIIGSPIGRAAIFSLYWTTDEDSAHRRYGFKLEYLLPFKQENENQIAGAPIGRMIGVAVSPVQGMFDGPENADGIAEQRQGVHQPRRWRILMYYMDHTVLSFELSKSRESESPDLEELVV
ncbi:hypothetical protein COCC4DRAFT_192422 [Bipolaris maydis ATCC 48331]|uniref:Uncharacterized protein n=2 Tax=Cochliobolus heterostrophus TaxID=5016 RepID=M2SQ11_COCH5|nr:uncharacterized protein COCC4DRAFT_192422 [Bipolaris maydis ATCC 48331]EMD87370.1 hypothetical protein COCHEDRAFT_1184288 [Bipolaris maydis C5]ENI06568.1 hypothetical protein COCC4DRAFT_192422 [Bipolaris maydis ATCC 48331]KAJ6212224.1 hypothetical protein PSV09DRAFT_1184288 [Bipolaris maydis]